MNRFYFFSLCWQEDWDDFCHLWRSIYFSVVCYAISAKVVIHKAFEITFEEPTVFVPNNWLYSAEDLGDFKGNFKDYSAFNYSQICTFQIIKLLKCDVFQNKLQILLAKYLVISFLLVSKATEKNNPLSQDLPPLSPSIKNLGSVQRTFQPACCSETEMHLLSPTRGTF